MQQNIANQTPSKLVTKIYTETDRNQTVKVNWKGPRERKPPRPQIMT